MGRKTVSEATKWQKIGMKDGSMINYREIARRLKISENCFKNTMKTLKHHAGSRRLKKLCSVKTVLYFVN